MGLTLEAEQRLQKVKLIALFDAHKAEWQAAAKRTHDYLKSGFPGGAAIRPDDVAKALKPILEVDKRLQDHLSVSKLTQKYWVSYFTDLVIDRVWKDIT